jgi:hypothetical protein
MRWSPFIGRALLPGRACAHLADQMPEIRSEGLAHWTLADTGPRFARQASRKCSNPPRSALSIAVLC